MVGALVARVVYFWLAVLAWLNRTICHPVAEWWLNNVVATWEETVKSFWREVVSYIVRFINGCSASFISLFVDGSYYACAPALFPPPLHNYHHLLLSNLDAPGAGQYPTSPGLPTSPRA